MTPEASQDLKDIFSYIAKTQEDAIYAKRLINKIVDQILSLHTFPRVGTNVRGTSNIYTVGVKKYRIAYAIHEPTKRVVIIRVGHSSRDFTKLI